jgi:hypothetical protein
LLWQATSIKWDANSKFGSTDVTTGELDIEMQATSVNSGVGTGPGDIKGTMTARVYGMDSGIPFIKMLIALR